MRLRIHLTLAASLVAFGLLAATASAGTAIQLKWPKPSWYTAGFHQQVLAAGARGVHVPAERLNLECPGIENRGVSAGGCVVEPFGCTANFIFRDSRYYYVGTARHCVRGTGSVVVMQVDTTTLAAIGTVVKKTSGEGDVGKDFALVRIYPSVRSRWGVRSAVPLTGGPRGVYTGCGAPTVKYWGHGYGAAVAQGKLYFGLATNWVGSGYGWTGAGILGDSGGPVLIAGDERAVGNFTHLIVDGDYLGSNLAGMRATSILRFVGSGIRLVNANRTTSWAGSACSSRTLGLFR
jgi:hypothetical protein